MTPTQITIALALVCTLLLPVLIAAGTRNIGRRPVRRRRRCVFDDQDFG